MSTIKPVTNADKKMSKAHIKAGKKLLKMSETYNKKHMQDHAQALKSVRTQLKSKYATTRSSGGSGGSGGAKR